MAQNKNSKKSEGLCHKIYNAINPFRSRIRRVSHHPHSSISITNDQKPKPVQNPKPVVHQPSLSKRVPGEFESTQKNKNNAAGKRGQDFVEREILIVSGQKLPKKEKAQALSGQKAAATKDYKPSNHGSFGKAKSNKEDDSVHETRFNDYIDKVRNRLLKTASSHLGDGSFKELR